MFDFVICFEGLYNTSLRACESTSLQVYESTIAMYHPLDDDVSTFLDSHSFYSIMSVSLPITTAVSHGWSGRRSIVSLSLSRMKHPHPSRQDKKPPLAFISCNVIMIMKPQHEHLRISRGLECPNDRTMTITLVYYYYYYPTRPSSRSQTALAVASCSLRHMPQSRRRHLI